MSNCIVISDLLTCKNVSLHEKFDLFKCTNVSVIFDLLRCKTVS